MKTDDLVQVYKTTIRPSAEYASPAWHSMITACQSESLERQQNQAMKNIYGVGLSARNMREKSGLERLWMRRETACEKFAIKNESNVRCNGWFVKRPEPQYARRIGATYNTYHEPIS